MVNCNKRQREIYKGSQQYRCIHPQAETRGEIVPEAICLACPLVKQRLVSCKEQQEQAIKDAYKGRKPQPKKQLPVLNLQPGYPECPFRFTRGPAAAQTCSITNLGVDPGICGRCETSTREQTASLGQKIVNYFGAIRRWVAHGRPRRSQEEIESLFEQHCRLCERYDPTKHACKNCGCAVSTDSEPLGNKLGMATEHCPLGRF